MERDESCCAIELQGNSSFSIFLLLHFNKAIVLQSRRR